MHAFTILRAGVAGAVLLLAACQTSTTISHGQVARETADLPAHAPTTAEIRAALARIDDDLPLAPQGMEVMGSCSSDGSCALPRSGPVPVTRERCCSETYISIGPEVTPGLGFGAQFGWRFLRRSNFALAAEIGFSYQDLTKWFMREGSSSKYWGARFGVKAEFGDVNRRRFVPFVRTGMQLIGVDIPRARESFQELVFRYDFTRFDRQGTSIGAFASVGFDVAAGPKWQIGPEVGFFYGVNTTRGGDDNYSLFSRLNFTFNF